MVTVGWASTKGTTRATNQDAVLVSWVGVAGHLPLLVAVADGMGGLVAGDEASRIAVSALQGWPQESNPAIELQARFRTADLKIREHARSLSTSERMGSTLVACFVSQDGVWIANVGDSRAYRVGESDVTQLTRDHSAVSEQMASGLLSPDEAVRSPYRHVLTRCLGADLVPPDIDFFKLPTLNDGEALLLCSDGLYSVLSDQEMAALIRTETPDDAVSALVALTQARGSRDDVSLVVVGDASILPKADKLVPS